MSASIVSNVPAPSGSSVTTFPHDTLAEAIRQSARENDFGFAISKALAEAGAAVCTATWPPALNIFRTLLERGKLDDARRLSDGSLLQFERIYPLDAAFDTMADVPA